MNANKVLTFKQLFKLLENVHPDKRTPKSLIPFFEAMNDEEQLEDANFNSRTIEIDEKAAGYLVKLIKPKKIHGDVIRVLSLLQRCALETNSLQNDFQILKAIGETVPQFGGIDFEAFTKAKSFNDLVTVGQVSFPRIGED